MSLMKTALVFLHGSGSNGLELRSYLETLPLEQFGYKTFRDVADMASITIFTPTSDVIPYTPMDGERMNVWFDRSSNFVSLGLNDSEDLNGSDRSIKTVLAGIDTIEKDYHHIIFGGFSMGGGLSLQVLRQDVPKLRGIFCISSFLVNSSQVFEGQLGSASKVPLLMMHGEADDFILCDWGRKTATNLLLRGVDVQFRTYPGVLHDISENELSDLFYWIQHVLNSCPATEDSKGSSSASTGGDVERSPPLGNLLQQVLPQPPSSSSSSAKSPITGEGAEASLDAAMQGLTLSMQDATRLRCAPYRIEYVDQPASSSSSSIPKVTIHYTVPQASVDSMCARPIMACGAAFDIVPDQAGGVMTNALSSDPRNTALEIGKRLAVRLSSGSADMNPCPIS
jgi:predicted esterase